MTLNTGKKILITGVGGPAGKAAYLFFIEKGFEVLGTDMRKLDGFPYFRAVPAATDPAYLISLFHVLDEEKIQWLLPTVTEELPQIAENREPIWLKGCRLFISHVRGARIINDKWETADVLRREGVSVPRSYCGTLKKELLTLLNFPILSKPRFGRGGRGVEIYQSEQDLPETLSLERVYQEFLPGEEYDVNLLAKPAGKTCVSVVLKKTAMKSGIVGNALSVERVFDKEIAQLAENAVRALSLEGPLDIDIRRGKNGQAGILEINGRIGANVRMAEEILETMIMIRT
ncbi:MAG: ATP-grasp domain-containing protein [Nitrospiria bacterium]